MVNNEYIWPEPTTLRQAYESTWTVKWAWTKRGNIRLQTFKTKAQAEFYLGEVRGGGGNGIIVASNSDEEPGIANAGITTLRFLDAIERGEIETVDDRQGFLEAVKTVD